MFVHTLHESREWSISLMSMAVTTHFLLRAILVANLLACIIAWVLPYDFGRPIAGYRDRGLGSGA
jgi:hypothetical protein